MELKNFFRTIGLVLSVVAGADGQRLTVSFNDGWRFALGDALGAEQAIFNDAAWRTLNVPHDWAFEADYAPDAAQTHMGGYKPGGVGWYRKAFAFDPAWENRRVFIEFDAVYMNSEVWINGHLLGKRPYGYISFSYDLTDYLKPGSNVLAVRVDNSREPSARWYHGCGIYAHVKLTVKAPLHIAEDGIFVSTPEVSDLIADVSVETELKNLSDKHPSGMLETILLDPSGQVVARDERSVQLKAGEGKTVHQMLQVKRPLRWSTETPHLYRTVSRVRIGDVVVDEVSTRFGIRTVRWETNTGFWLNGENLKLKGVCDHLEAGPVGAAKPDELIRWQIQLLKDMGCNAIRTAHNPQVPVFYDLCDEMGMLVMDEIFDGWKKKAPEDYGSQAFDEWWERDLRAFMKRNRNHPSVVIWSVGNETGGPVAKDLVRVCHEMDPTRFVTSGHSGSRHMDVFGVNGHSEKQHFYDHSPNKPFVATEAPHTWQVRGFYRTQAWFRDGYPSTRQDPFPCPDLTEKEIFIYDWTEPENKKNRKQVFNSSYDNAMVRITARKQWELARDLPWYAGHFRWTGFDYLGEARLAHGGWPFRAFMGGALDLAGFEKDLYYFYQSQWTDAPMAHILPHWTHPKMDAGTKIPVWVYSNCDEVELFLNGKSLGKDRPGKQWDEMQCDWMVPWTPGTLEAVGYRNGKEAARAKQETAGKPAALAVAVAGKECPIVTVAITDEKGVVNPYGENRIHYHFDGPVRILSLESGNPVNTENNFGATSRAAFFGLARAFLQVTAGEGAISAVAGAICGEPQLLTSDLVHIDVQPFAVRGESPRRNLKVLYSLDGSDPATVYAGPFRVAPGTEVKASVFDGGRLLFVMRERFGPGQGLYWGSRASIGLAADTGEQAENAFFSGAKVSTAGNGYHGGGFLDFGDGGGWVEWYQENDGSPGMFTLRFRYACNDRKRTGRSMKLTVNGRVVEPELFFRNTGSWGDDWSTVSVDVMLNSGANAIRLSTGKDGGVLLDELNVE